MKSIDYLGHFGSCQTSYDAFNNSNTLSKGFPFAQRNSMEDLTVCPAEKYVTCNQFPNLQSNNLSKKEITFI